METPPAKPAGTSTVDDLPQRKRAATGLHVWWAQMCNLGPEAYGAGQILDLSVLTQLEELRTLRGPDARIKKLLVRRDFDALYRSLITTGGRQTDWLGSIGGSSGVGKSAFFWYFIIRVGIDMKGLAYRIVYQSGNYIWEFRSSGQASVVKKGDYPVTSLANATWHLVNQRVEAGDPLGPRVLVAASPERSNTKNAKPDRKFSLFFVYPWEEDEFNHLVHIWLDEAVATEKMAEELKLLAPPPPDVPEEDMRDAYVLNSQQAMVQVQDLDLVAEELQLEAKQAEQRADFGTRVWSVLRCLKDRANDTRVRAAAAKLYFSWFGGVARWLWQLDVKELNAAGFEKRVNDSLSNTDLSKILQAVRSGAKSDDISWLLLHFTRPAAGGQGYVLEFASSKVKFLFTAVLAKTKDEDLKALLHSSDPQLGSLRGYIFEQEVVGQILSSRLNAVLMVDNKRCQTCNGRVDNGTLPEILWIACDQCHKWYHQLCVGITHVMALTNWICPHCQGWKLPQPVSSGGLSLRYYEGELKDALLAAGKDARLYVWRPLRQNNAAFGFAILPRTLGHTTTAKDHKIPFEAVQKGVDALKAWNRAYNQEQEPESYLLAFFLMSKNFPTFGYQSYCNKLRRVSDKGVKGVEQVKVLVRTSGEELLPHLCSADIVSPPNPVEKLEDLFQGGVAFEDMTLVELKALAKTWGMSGYSSLNKDRFISRLEAGSTAPCQNREYERLFYKDTYPSRCY